MSKVNAYKGFNSDWTCRDFQFAIGETYEHDGQVEACRSGFHACTNPIDVFQYYPPGTSRFAEVVLSGDQNSDGNDSKVAAAKITIKAEISPSDMIERAVKAIFDAAALVKGSVSKKGGGAASATGYGGAASATGDGGAASATGYGGAASATGYKGAASATGNKGAASATGDGGAASATGYRGAASATGYGGAASATGYGGAASATGDGGAAMASGHFGKAKGVVGCVLFLVERDNQWNIIAHWSGLVGENGIEPDTFYTLLNGQPVKAEGQS